MGERGAPLLGNGEDANDLHGCELPAIVWRLSLVLGSSAAWAFQYERVCCWGAWEHDGGAPAPDLRVKEFREQATPSLPRNGCRRYECLEELLLSFQSCPFYVLWLRRRVVDSNS